MDTMATIQDLVNEIFPADIVATTTIRSLCLDELDLVDLIISIEDEFKIEIPDATAETFQTFGEIAKYVNQKIEEREECLTGATV